MSQSNAGTRPIFRRLAAAGSVVLLLAAAVSVVTPWKDSSDFASVCIILFAAYVLGCIASTGTWPSTKSAGGSRAAAARKVDLLLENAGIECEATPTRPASLERKLDLLLEHAGLEYDPVAGLPEGVEQALRDGKQIVAIKLVREATGVGLREAMEFIEEVERRGGF